MPTSLPDLDLDTITDPALREPVTRLLSVVEETLAANQRLRDQIQALRDEIARLKGEQGKPKFPRERPADPHPDHSSEAERKSSEPQQRRKTKKVAALEIDRTQPCTFPHAIPPGWQFKGQVETVIQDLIIRRDNIRFVRPKYYDPVTGKTHTAPLPAGYWPGYEFGPGIRQAALTFLYETHVSFPSFHRLLLGAGIRISRGTVSGLATAHLDRFHAEQAAVLAAGLASSPWQQTDVTHTRVKGEGQSCHVLLNPLYTCYYTAPQQDRATVLDLLQFGAPRRYRLDALTLELLTKWRCPEAHGRKLAELRSDTLWDAHGFADLLTQHLPLVGLKRRRQIEDAAQIAAYRATSPDVVACLLTDNCSVYNDLTSEQGLCWVHDARHYLKLMPRTPSFQQELAAFMDEYWNFYRKLLAYREAPRPAEAVQLEAEFERLFRRAVHHQELAKCQARTRGNKAQLLLVLRHPELPLHNNAAELAARRRVRKRDVSLGPRSPAGVRAWDTLQGLVETTRKLGVKFTDYLEDRLKGLGKIPPLAELIRQRAGEQALGASWAAG